MWIISVLIVLPFIYYSRNGIAASNPLLRFFGEHAEKHKVVQSSQNISALLQQQHWDTATCSLPNNNMEYSNIQSTCWIRSDLQHIYVGNLPHSFCSQIYVITKVFYKRLNS